MDSWVGRVVGTTWSDDSRENKEQEQKAATRYAWWLSPEERRINKGIDHRGYQRRKGEAGQDVNKENVSPSRPQIRRRIGYPRVSSQARSMRAGSEESS